MNAMNPRYTLEAVSRRALVDEPLLVRQALAFFGDRSTEWASALMMVWWGICLALPGATLEYPQFQDLLRYGLTEEKLAVALGFMGVARIMALWVNGKQQAKTGYARAIGSLIGCVIWGQIAVHIFHATWVATGVASPGIGQYAILALFDLLGISRAMFDVRYHRS